MKWPWHPWPPWLSPARRGIAPSLQSKPTGLPLHPEVRAVLETQRATFEKLGCIVEEAHPDLSGADEAFLTPSAVSYQMKELEELLGVQLFERKSRSLELTIAGHTLRDEIEPLLEALDRSLALISRRTHRRLRVHVPRFFASELLVLQLAKFC